MIILQIITNAITTGLLYSLVALGFYLIYSSTKIFHIAYGAVYTMTPYLFLMWIFVLGFIMPKDGWLVFLTAIILTLFAGCLLSVFSEAVIFRPLFRIKASPAVLLISSLGLYITLVNLTALLFGSETKILTTSEINSFDLGGIIVTQIQIVQVLASLAVIGSILLILYKTELGRSIRALSDNPTLVSVLGINVKRLRTQVFFLGAFLAGVAALLKSFDTGADLRAGLPVVITAAVAVIIGGLTTAWGAILGSLLLGLTHNVVAWTLSAEWQNAATFVFFVAILLVRKEGILAPQLRLEER